jgi:acylglycerol lipase
MLASCDGKRTCVKTAGRDSQSLRLRFFTLVSLLAICCSFVSPALAKEEPGAVPCMIWMDPAGPKKGILLCVHGLGLHKGCYQQFAERMTPQGWGVYAMDVRGFGEFMTMPQGARRVNFDGCLQDVKEVLTTIHSVHPGMPVFIVGESMGGGIALQAGSMYSDLVDGIVSACPASKRHHSTAAAVKVATNLLLGKKSMDVRPILVEQSTKKQELRDMWLSDAQGRFELAPIELIQFQFFMDRNVKAARQLTKTPICILQGGSDRLVIASAQNELWSAVPKTNEPTLIFVDGSEHLILEEGQFKDDLIATVSEWLDSHLPAAATPDQKDQQELKRQPQP